MADAAVGRDSSVRPVTEFVVRFDGSDCALFEVAQQTECEFEVEQVVSCPDGSMLEYLRTSGVDPDRLVASLHRDPAIYDARVVHRGELTTRVELNTDGEAMESLVDHGVIYPRISGTSDATTLTAYVPRRVDAGTAMDAFLSRYPEADILSKRRTALDAPALSRNQVVSTVLAGLTDRQITVLRVALANGYFEVPRETTGEEVAEMLDISGATFSSHIRAAEANLLAALF